MRNLIVDTEFAALIPPLTEDEYAGLKTSLQADGCRDALIVWNGTIIDGHNRYKLCNELNIQFKTVEKQFDSREDAMIWIIDNQFARRNLNNFVRSELAYKREGLIAPKAKEHQIRKPKSVMSTLSEQKPILVRKEAAKIANTSQGTYYKAKHVIENAPEEVKQKTRSGEYSVNQAYKLTRDLKGDKNISTLLTQAISHEWYTPVKYIEAARSVLGTIDIDPASSDIANKTVSASIYYTKDTNGLDKSWPGKVWLNPPYKGLSIDFVTRLLEQYNAGITIEAILLLNANSTETKWFAPLWDYVLCFTDHRINFLSGVPSTTNSTHGSVFVYLGQNEKKFYQEFKQFGYVVKRVQYA